MEVEGSDEVGILPADAVATSATFVVWLKLLNQAFNTLTLLTERKTLSHFGKSYPYLHCLILAPLAEGGTDLEGEW